MRDFVARAMQISYLTKEQIEQIHERERAKGYLIPNWNIQELLNIPSIKDKYGLEEDSLPAHNARIETDIRAKFRAHFDISGDGYLDWMHGLDWGIHNRSGEIVWEFSGSKGKGRLRNQVEGMHVIEPD